MSESFFHLNAKEQEEALQMAASAFIILVILVTRAGVQPATFALGVRCSMQLSYRANPKVKLRGMQTLLTPPEAVYRELPLLHGASSLPLFTFTGVEKLI